MPDLQLGFFNAWIFTMYIFVPTLVMQYLLKSRYNSNCRSVSYSRKERMACITYKSIFYLGLAYSFFLPLKTSGLSFVIGVPICFVSLLIYSIACCNFSVTPRGELVHTGIYKFSRHPMYLSILFLFFGIFIVTGSMIFLIFTMCLLFFMPTICAAEERHCLDMFGLDYEKYQETAGKWLGIGKKQ